MKVFVCRMTVVLSILSVILLFPDETRASMKTCAYIDPGTGSFVIQLLIGAVCGGLFAVKLFWSKIVNFFRRLSCTDRKDGNSGRK
jgi:hypothetical protein